MAKKKGRNTQNPVWTPALTDRLCIAWFEHPGSTDDIAKDLGFKKKGAIIGKAHRVLGNIPRPDDAERQRRREARAAGNPIPFPSKESPLGTPPEPASTPEPLALTAAAQVEEVDVETEAPEETRELPAATQLPRATPRGSAFERAVELQEARRLRSEWISAPSQPSVNEPPGPLCTFRLLNIETREERDCGKETLLGSPYCPGHTIEMRERTDFRRNFDPLADDSAPKK